MSSSAPPTHHLGRPSLTNASADTLSRRRSRQRRSKRQVVLLNALEPLPPPVRQERRRRSVTNALGRPSGTNPSAVNLRLRRSRQRRSERQVVPLNASERLPCPVRQERRRRPVTQALPEPVSLESLELSLSAAANARRERTMQRARTPVEAPPANGWWNSFILRIGRTPPISIPWRETPCQFCGTLLLRLERKDFCCRNGSRALPTLPPYPTEFRELIERTPAVANSCSRRLNNLFCFSSIGVDGQFKYFSPPSNVILQGRVYHQVRDVAFGQHSLRWFLYDEDGRNAQARSQAVPQEYVNAVRSLLELESPYVRELRHAFSTVPEHLPMYIELENAPTASGELAAIVHTANLQEVHPRSIYISRCGASRAQRVSILDAQYEPLQYPIFFPQGTPGWTAFEEGSLSQIDWYRARILSEPRFRVFGRLTNEYLVDMFSRAEEERLDYIRRGRWQQLEDARIMREEAFIIDPNPNLEPESTVTLPDTFIGSRAWASKHVGKALALCKEYGKTSFLLTMTTNPRWPEIQSQLGPGQNASDIPVVVCRAFKARLQCCLNYIRRKLGKIIYLIQVVEFQKRGLPHVHMVFKVHPELPFSFIDSVVWARLPDEREYPNLRAKVLQYNMHSKDHLQRIPSRCNKKGKCSFNFPKPLMQSATLDGDGRVLYRRDTEEDRWVVSYMPCLTELLDCHINVDVCFTVNVFMYLYKYLFKGPDRTRFAIKNAIERREPAPERAEGGEGSTERRAEVVDEIRDYLSARYLSATEAAWRILRFDITRMTPAVRSIRVHLPGSNFAQMHRNDGASGASALLRYFYRPEVPLFDSLKILEYYRLFRCEPLSDLRVNEWLERPCDDFPQQKVIRRNESVRSVSRLENVLPRLGELYYLRMLLLHQAGRSFSDMRTVSGVTHATFQEAATALGLFADGEEARNCLLEAHDGFASPKQLRFLFAQVVLNLPCSAPTLFSEFQEFLAGDFIDQGLTDFSVLARTLEDLALHFQAGGASLSQFGLPEPPMRAREADLEDEFFDNGLREQYIRALPLFLNSLLPDQRRAFSIILEAVRQFERPSQPLDDIVLPPQEHLDEQQPFVWRSRNCFFLDGKAGRGKTWLLNGLVRYLRGKEYSVVVCGTSALSATLYPRGRTAHSLFGIPVVEENTEVNSRIGIHSDRAEYLRNVDLIIWEELPMANKAAVECVDALLRNLTNCSELFGGKMIIGCGDFRQVAPVVKDGGPSATFDASIRSSNLWGSFNILRLYEPVRNAADPAFSTWVDTVGEGSSSSSEELIQLPEEFTTPFTDINFAEEFLFPQELLSEYNVIARRSFLSPLNLYVDDFNERILRSIESQERVYFSLDSVKEEESSSAVAAPALLEYLAITSEPGIPPHELKLKVGCLCSLMRNLSIDSGLVKNARVIVRRLYRHVIEVETLPNDCNGFQGACFPLPRITFEFRPKFCPWTVQRRQFPLRLAYATTFNSCQGLTLDRAVIDVRVPVFAHGQLYTAFSRVRSRLDLGVLRPMELQAIAGGAQVEDEERPLMLKNVVYRELLL